jgi:hypothetical protein
MLICKEILEELGPSHPDRKCYDTFHMSIYCFPDPENHEQLEIIRALGHQDNVARDIRVESPDYVRLYNVRREALKNREENPSQVHITSYHS